MKQNKLFVGVPLKTQIEGKLLATNLEKYTFSETRILGLFIDSTFFWKKKIFNYDLDLDLLYFFLLLLLGFHWQYLTKNACK